MKFLFLLVFLMGCGHTHIYDGSNCSQIKEDKSSVILICIKNTFNRLDRKFGKDY